MKKIAMTMTLLVMVVSCSTTEVPQTKAPEENQNTAGVTQPVDDTKNVEQKTSKDQPVKNTLKKIAKPFKKFGSDVEQAFDRLSTKDKDGDGE